MIYFSFIMAQAKPVDNQPTPSSLATSGIPYIIIILGAILAVAVVATIVILLLPRKRKHRHRHHHHKDHPKGENPSVKPTAGESTAGNSERNDRRSRRRRRHRPINPTLAQTGGLPPMRDPNTPPAGL